MAREQEIADYILGALRDMDKFVHGIQEQVFKGDYELAAINSARASQMATDIAMACMYMVLGVAQGEWENGTDQ